jgi:HAD superfamily hydrolase (TIGR01509 family)
MTKAIIFDLDGLLVDSEHIWHIVETNMIEERGHVYRQDVRDKVVGLRVDECMAIMKEAYQFKETVQELFDEVVARHLKRVPDEVTAKPGAKEIIDYVHNNNIPTAIASSSPLSIINAEVDAQGWDDYFAIRCTAADDKYGKPAPDVYIRAAKTVGIDPTDCIALEDSPNGARAAVAAGMTCYAVPDPAHSGPEAFEGITPHVFANLHEVLETLKANTIS